MKTQAKYFASLASLTLLLLAGLPAYASHDYSSSTADVGFYEPTEPATFEFAYVDTNGDGRPDSTVPVKRTGEGSLAGDALLGKSPLCPSNLVKSLAAAGMGSTSAPCYVTANGKDVIDLRTGTGTFEAEIQMKVQADNPMDSPELVVMYATIKGSLQVRDSKFRRMSIQNAVLTITYVLDPRSMSYVLPAAVGLQTTYSTTGTVRLPFLNQSGGKGKKKEKNTRTGAS